MLQMMKRDFQIHSYQLIPVFIFTPLVYVMDSSIVAIYLFAIFYLNFIVFYSDHKSHVNRFLVSMPLQRKPIILGRYVFFLISFLIIMIYHLVIDSLAQYGLPYLNGNPLNGQTIVLVFSGISIAMAISVPIYYYFTSYLVAVSVQITLFLIGAVSYGIIMGNPYIKLSLFMLNVIVSQHYIIYILFSLGCLYASYRLSARIFIKKDII